jgi:hypothetical protein
MGRVRSLNPRDRQWRLLRRLSAAAIAAARAAARAAAASPSPFLPRAATREAKPLRLANNRPTRPIRLALPLPLSRSPRPSCPPVRHRCHETRTHTHAHAEADTHTCKRASRLCAQMDARRWVFFFRALVAGRRRSHVWETMRCCMQANRTGFGGRSLVKTCACACVHIRETRSLAESDRDRQTRTLSSPTANPGTSSCSRVYVSSSDACVYVCVRVCARARKRLDACVL